MFCHFMLETSKVGMPLDKVLVFAANASVNESFTATSFFIFGICNLNFRPWLKFLTWNQLANRMFRFGQLKQDLFVPGQCMQLEEEDNFTETFVKLLSLQK